MDKNSHTECQTVQIQISWLLQKPSDLDLHCLQRQGIFSRTWINETSTPVDHFVLSPREKDKRASKGEERETGGERKVNDNQRNCSGGVYLVIILG